MVLKGKIDIEKLAVVAGGDCHNALVDGEKVDLGGTPTHYFFYPFEDDVDYLRSQLIGLEEFLGGIKDKSTFNRVREVKDLGLALDKKRTEAKIPTSSAFKMLVSFSDFQGDITQFRSKVMRLLEDSMVERDPEDEGNAPRVALLGVPPIYPDFHEVASSLKLHIVFDELPFEFVRLTGSSIEELAKNYRNYTFARDIGFRLEFLEKELEPRRVDGIVHYTQFACHHVLEDDILREKLDYPILTVQGDLPRRTPEQVKLRLEAFSESLSRR
jgi:benzoyl-CoA reductase/2-hydroxyglutaryl-CoA dehydratase subunit BcrC/BadD/HgdB